MSESVTNSAPDFPDLVRVIHWRAEQTPDRLALVYLDDGATETERLTYAELDQRARAIGALLQDRGAVGEPVLLLYPQGVEFVVSFFACLYAGAIAVTSPPPRSQRALPRIAGIIDDCKPTIALATAETLDLAHGDNAHAAILRRINWLDVDTRDVTPSDRWRSPSLHDSDIAFLQYTSGSTAQPKGVMVGHGNLTHNLRMLSVAHGNTDETPTASWLPVHHDMGLMCGILEPLFVGTHTVFMPPLRFIQTPIRWLRAISRYRPHTSGAPNFAYDLCVHKTTPEEREGLDLSSWRTAFNGAEPVRAQTLQEFAACFAEYGFRAEALYPNYGLAESTVMVSGGRKWELPVVRCYDDEALDRHVAEPVDAASDHGRPMVSSGREVLDQEIAIVEPETRVLLAERRVGEIWVHGPSVAQGYWGRAEETERDFRARLAGSGKGPYLRTGDLGFLDGGELFITGRLKDLIIFHGRNVYPHDIEGTARESHELLRTGAGAAFTENGAGEERIVLVHEVGRRYRNVDLADVVTAVRSAVWAELEVPLHAVVLVKPATVPKTTSGKVMRHAIRDRHADDGIEAVWSDVLEWQDAPAAPAAGTSRAPVAPGEDAAGVEDVGRFLRQRVAAALELPAERIDGARPVHALGLDSLTAARLAGDVEDELGIGLQITTFMQDDSLDEIAAALARRLPDGRLPDPDQRPRRAAAANGHHAAAPSTPLTRGQRALWFQQQLVRGTAAYNVAITARIRGPLDDARLDRALAALADRHPLLRAPLVTRGGEAYFAAPADGFAIERIDVAAGDPAAMSAAIGEAVHRPFAIEGEPLSRAVLFRRSADDHVVLLCLHHIVCDGWSVNVLVRELVRLYADPDADLPAPAAYLDFLAKQEAHLASPDGTLDLDHWRARLRDAPEALDLPVAGPRPPVQSLNGGSVPFALEPRLLAALHRLAQDTGATPYVVLQAVFQVLLHRHTELADFLVGTITAGRTERAFENTVGYFVNPVVLRADVAGIGSFRDLVGRTRARVHEALERQHLPFAVLVEQLNPRRDPGRSPLFQVAFGLTQLPFEAVDGFAATDGEDGIASDGVRFFPFFVPQQEGQFDLNLEFFETPKRIFGSLNYDRGLFAEDVAQRLVGHFLTLLDAVVADPDASVRTLPMLTADEQRRIAAWNARAADVPPLGSFEGACIHHLIEDTAAGCGGAIAVEGRGRALTYEELNRRANQLAHHLRGLGIGRDDLVGVFIEKSVEMVVALVAVLKAGGAYVPLDPDYPDERVLYMLSDSGAKALITSQRLRHRLPSAGVPAVALDDDWADIARRPAADPPRVTTESDLAYAIYTSGSTGRPKGVMVPHRAACNRLRWKEAALPVGPEDRILQTIPYSFDPSVWEIFTPLIAGARVVIPRPGTQQDPDGLIEQIVEHQITAISCVPALLGHLLDRPEFGRCSSLRAVICGGEPLSPALHDRFLERSRARLHHFYGPTEATVFATHWPCVAPATGAKVPIGHPVAHARVHILDANQQPVPLGAPGELYLGGEGLARGYLDNPEQTRVAFVPDPFADDAEARLYRTGDLARYRDDGAIEFLGRIDTQVKVRGFRIELGEVEARLKAFDGIGDAVVVARDDGGGGRLVAYVVPRDDRATTTTELRTFVAAALPDYMVPSVFVPLDALPVGPTGKIDRRALPEPGPAADAQAEKTAPTDALEAQLVAIWESVLDVKPIGTRENFFDLGGHSLLALRILTRIEKALGVRLRAATIFASPTIAALAEAMRRETVGIGSRCIECVQPGRGLTPFFCAAPGHGDIIRFAALAQRLESERPVYALLPPMPADDGRDTLVIDDLALRYVDEIRAVQPRGPYLIGGFSVGGVVAFEVARRLVEQGEDVAATVLLDTVFPTWSTGSLSLFRLIKFAVTRLGFARALLIGGRGLREIFTDRGLESQLRAIRHHKVKAYPGRAVLVISRGNANFQFQFFSKWRRFARGGVERRLVPGWHGSMFRDPYVRDLARLIGEVLDRADGRRRIDAPDGADAAALAPGEPAGTGPGLSAAGGRSG